MSVPRSIVIVNPFGIGDVLFSTPLVRALRRAFPAAHLAYLGNRRTEEILKRNPHLDELFIYEKDEFVSQWRRSRWAGARKLVGLMRQIRRGRFDVAVDLSLGARYGFVLAALGVPRRIGFDFRRRGRFLTHRLVMDGYADRHVVEYYAQLLEMIGVHLREPSFELAASEDDRQAAQAFLGQQLGGRRPRCLIGVIPAGGVSWGLQAHFRRWSTAGFIEVGRALTQRHEATILVFGEAKDRGVCRELTTAIGPAAKDLSGQTSLGQFISLIGQCDLVISNDGGPIHIAASQGVPTVSIFGPVDPTVYGPYPLDGRHRIVYRDDLWCRPCYRKFKLPPCPYERACLTELSPADVLAVCEQALERAALNRDAETFSSR